MKTREDRISAKANELRQVDGHPDSKDRQYWSEAAQLIDEEDKRIAEAAVEEPSRLTQPGAERRGPWPTEDAIGIVATKRQG